MHRKISSAASSTIVVGMYACAIFAVTGISGIQAASTIVFASLVALATAGGAKKLLFDEKYRAAAFASLFYVSWGLAASLSSRTTADAALRLVPFAGALALFWGFAALPEKTKPKIIEVLLVFAAVQSIYAAAQYFTGIDITRGGFTEPFGRARGTLGGFNSLGGVMAMVLPVAASATVFSCEKKK